MSFLPQSSDPYAAFGSLEESEDPYAAFGSPEETQQKPKGFTQGAYEFLKESEDEERELERHRARGTSRILERTLGLPGDIVQLLEGITGGKSDKSTKFGLPSDKFPLPTSSSLKEKSERLTKGYTSPKTEAEEKSDEFLGDIASTMLPGGPAYSAVRNIGVPLAGALVKEGIQRITGDKESGNYTKLGAMFMLDLILARRATVPRRPGIRGALDMGGPQSYVSSLFRESEASLPQGPHMIDATQLQLSLRNLRNNLQRGGTRASRTRALTAIDELEARIQNGQIDIHELPEFRTRINEDIQQLGGWDFNTPPAIRERAVRNLTDVKRHVIRAGEDYGLTQNPEFLAYWRSANEAQSVLSRSNVVSNFVERTIGDRIISKGVRNLFGIGGGTAAAHKVGLSKALVSGGASAVGASAYGTGKLLYRVIQSPTLREYYFNTITAALNGQKGVLIKNLTALEDALKEEDKKQKND